TPAASAISRRPATSTAASCCGLPWSRTAACTCKPAPASLRTPTRARSNRNASTRPRRCFGLPRKRDGLRRRRVAGNNEAWRLRLLFELQLFGCATQARFKRGEVGKSLARLCLVPDDGVSGDLQCLIDH